MTKKRYWGLLILLPLFLIAMTPYLGESNAANQDDSETECREGMVLFHRTASNDYICLSMSSASSWENLGLGERVSGTTQNENMEESMMESMENKYTYTQEFLPVKKMEIDLETTAVFITDPQNDFISEGGAAWEGVGEQVIADKVVEHQVALRDTAKEVGIPVFYSPHTYTEMDYANWKLLNPIDQLMFDVDMFHEGTWGHEFHPDLVPDDNTVVMNPHKGLSNFHAGDAKMQLRQYGIETLIMAGMSANLCVESHLRDAIENGFEVIVIADATAGFGPHAKNAALINFEFIANEVTTTDDIISRLRQAANS